MSLILSSAAVQRRDRETQFFLLLLSFPISVEAKMSSSPLSFPIFRSDTSSGLNHPGGLMQQDVERMASQLQRIGYYGYDINQFPESYAADHAGSQRLFTSSLCTQIITSCSVAR